jgi:hypothetical protein
MMEHSEKQVSNIVTYMSNGHLQSASCMVLAIATMMEGSTTIKQLKLSKKTRIKKIIKK